MTKYLSLLKKITFTITTLLFLLIILIVFSSLREPVDQDSIDQSCNDINELTSIEYAGCYDAFSQTIFFEVKNTNFISPNTKIKISFFDYLQQTYAFDIPHFEESLFQRIPAEINPISADIYLISSDNNYCNIPKQIQIDYCPSDFSDSNNVSLKLISDVAADEFEFAGSKATDTVSEELIDEEKIWESICKSDWECSRWGDCINNIQKRECSDNNQCGIPTSIPQKVRSCNIECVENWDCEWSKCENGFSTPTCTELNNCGTNINKPQKIPCSNRCIPDVVCGEWGPCEANYDFLTLTKEEYVLSGIQRRTCTDKNACIATSSDSQACSLVIDIYTKDLIKCGKEYISIYNSLDNKFIANIEKNEQRDIVNIDLSSEKSLNYCDFCFDGFLNGDEQQIDCGGSCESCDKLRVDKDFSKPPLQRFFEGVRNFLS